MARKIDDRGVAKAEWTIEKYYGDFKNVEEIKRKGAKPYEVVKVEKNILLAEGIQAIWQLVAGVSGVTPFNASNAHIGVGDGTASASRDQTGLQGTNKYYKLVDSAPVIEQDTGVSPPTYRITFVATFGSDEANFSWNEATVANGSSDTAVNLNRVVGTFGTKTSGSTWVATCRVRLT
jgi:hypothetical protein